MSDELKTKEELIRELAALREQVAKLAEVRPANSTVPTTQELMDALLGNIPDAIYFKDRQGRFIKVGHALALKHGVADPNQVLGKTDFDFFEKEHAQATFDIEQEIMRTGTPVVNIESPEVWADRPPTWVSVTKMPLRNEAGEIIGLFGLSRDITHRKQVEQSLRESEQFFRILFETSPDGIVLIDPHNKNVDWPIVECNEPFCRMNGYSREELIGKSIDLLNAEKPNPGNSDYLQRVREFGPLEVESAHIRKDGRLITVHTNTCVMMYQGRELVLGIDRDVTARKEMEASLAQAHGQAVEASRLKSQFLANMSHELRTPLNSIIGFSQILIDGLVGELNEQQKEFTNDILSSAQHLLGLINDVLDMSKIEAGQMAIHPEPFQFEELGRETAAAIRALIDNKAQQLVLEIPDNLPELNADRFRIKQVLLNLLSNANKFTPTEGTITLKARMMEDSTLLISVVDTGAGISDSDINLIFQEFRQADNTTTREAGGTGLGLPISKRLIEMHGGAIWVESEPGQGSTFSVLLPIGGPSGHEARVIDHREQTTVVGNREHPLVFIVEDDRGFSNLLAFRFTHEGYNVVQLFTGAEIVELAKKHKPTVITLDIRLPEVDGWQVLRVLKSNPETAEIPVIVISEIEERELGLQLGALDYLVKPLTMEDFKRVLSVVRDPHKPKPAHVVVLDDESDMGHLISLRFPRNEFKVTVMMNPVKALNAISEDPPDALVLDLSMPYINGFEFLTQIRAIEQLQNLPVIVFSALHLTAEQRTILDLKAQAVIPKGGPQTFKALLAKMRELRGIEEVVVKEASPHGSH